MSNFWGRHFILDLFGCPKDKITDPNHILEWGRELIRAIDMIAYGKPLLENFAHENEKTGGYTYIQMIETSNICAHFAENLGEVYIDVFSCKDFSPDVAAEISRKYFEPSKIISRDIIRGGSEPTCFATIKQV